MTINVEYLLIVQKADTFCDSVEAFNRLLQVDSAISLKRDKIRHHDNFECDYRITTGEITGKEQRFFHVGFSIESESEESIAQFTCLLKTVRTTMNRLGNQPETLWDDISFYYARKAYPHIYRIENLMRKLIANFMLVTIGKEWISETSPSEFTAAIASSSRKGYVNVLHAVDFIDLAAFLLKPYSKQNMQELYVKLKKARTVEELTELQTYIPESNWTRYFAQLVDCEDSYLQKRWEELYGLRCKVAHNAILNKADYERIMALISEVDGKLNDAINKLPQLKIPQAEVEQIAENAASNVSVLVGDFIMVWRILETEILRKAAEAGVETKSLMQACEVLVSKGVLDTADHQSLRRVQAIRNHLLHPTGVAVSEDDLQSAIRRLLHIITSLEYVGDSSIRSGILAQMMNNWDSQHKRAAYIAAASSHGGMTLSKSPIPLSEEEATST
jgi:hypothetical protein